MQGLFSFVSDNVKSIYEIVRNFLHISDIIHTDYLPMYYAVINVYAPKYDVQLGNFGLLYTIQ